MLKGINIGGEKREKYLDFLKTKQDENLEKLEKIYFLGNKKDQVIEESDLKSINDKDKDYEHRNSLNDLNMDKSNLYKDFNEKYKEVSNHVEKEHSF